MFKNLVDRFNDYIERKEADRFAKFMGEVEAEARHTLLFNEPIRQMHQSPEAWRLTY
jgi:hypothetical protein